MSTKILTTYKYASDKTLLAMVHVVLGKMDSNINFAQPPAALGTLKTALQDFVLALTAASNGDHEKLAIKKAKKGVIVELLAELITYVTLVSNGDRAKLLSSGFELTRSQGDISMGDIKGLQITAERPGEAITRIKRVAGARAYIHKCTAEPLTSDSVWVTKFVTEPICHFTGLQSKERYLFKVVAVGIKGQEVISPEIARVIQ